MTPVPVSRAPVPTPVGQPKSQVRACMGPRWDSRWCPTAAKVLVRGGVPLSPLRGGAPWDRAPRPGCRPPGRRWPLPRGVASLRPSLPSFRRKNDAPAASSASTAAGGLADIALTPTAAGAFDLPVSGLRLSAKQEVASR